MKSLLYIFPFFLCAISFQAKSQSDTLDAQQFIDREIKKLRVKKPRQIMRIENKDSTIIYGADKGRTHLLLVSSHNRNSNRHVQFQYNEEGVFCITVLRGVKKKNRSYYFHKGKLIGTKRGDGSDDIESLIADANRHLKLGTEFLIQR